jgi:hypothetical protein
MARFAQSMPLLVIWSLLCAHTLVAQSENVSLGDLARNLRKNQPPPRAVIDNDNLPSVMEDGENKRWSRSGIPSSSSDAAMKIVNASNPDVTCALSFTGQKDLVEDELHPQNLPQQELAKLEGPGAIVGDSLQLSLHNGSTWDVREITVSLTVVQREYDALTQLGGLQMLPATMNSTVAQKKRSDLSVLYHMKGTSAPSSTRLFQAPLGVALSPDQDWHWAIVQAKGSRPVTASELPASERLIQAPN